MVCIALVSYVLVLYFCFCYYSLRNILPERYITKLSATE